MEDISISQYLKCFVSYTCINPLSEILKERKPFLENYFNFFASKFEMSDHTLTTVIPCYLSPTSVFPFFCLNASAT